MKLPQVELVSFQSYLKASKYQMVSVLCDCHVFLYNLICYWDLHELIAIRSLRRDLDGMSYIELLSCQSGSFLIKMFHGIKVDFQESFAYLENVY